ncbi:MAG: membrane protein insertase YidC [Bacteroidales bacterium]|nr:membrane protein insertase YidC [Bacteroidales bacterium]
MDRNTVTGLILMFVVIAVFAWWNAPSAEEREQMIREQQEQRIAAELQRVQDSLALVYAVETGHAPSVQPTDERPEIVRDEQNFFSNSLVGEKQTKTLITDKFTVDFSNLGGTMSRVSLNDFLVSPHIAENKHVTLFDNEWHNFFIEFAVNARTVNQRIIRTYEYFFEITSNFQDGAVITGDQTAEVAMRLFLNDGYDLDRSRYVEFLYRFRGNEYMIDFQINFVGMAGIVEPATGANTIDLHWNAVLPRNERASAGNEARSFENTNTGIFFKPNNARVDRVSRGDGEERINTPVNWVAFRHHFFTSALIMKDNNSIVNANLTNSTDPNLDRANYVRTLDALIGLPYRSEPNHSINMKLYLGPNSFSILSSYNLDLERLVPLGWGFFLMQWVNRFAVIPVFNFLQGFNLNYGIIILILTVLLKLVLAPLTLKSWISAAKMKVVRPEVEELNKKFPKPEQAMEKQKAVMALYRKAGINQLAGCIPMLLQFPILIAMFRFFPNSIELRQQPFLWADDLSTYDSIINLPFNIPFYGAHISLFAIMMAVSNVFYTRMTMRQNASTMMPGMKTMMYFMPIMLLMFLNSFSSALNYYYFVSTCMTFLITWVTGRFIN